MKKPAPPAGLSKEAAAFFKAIIRDAGLQYTVTAADVALAGGAAQAFDMMSQAAEFMAAAHSEKDFKGWKDAQASHLAGARSLRASLTALRLSADSRSEKKARQGAAEAKAGNEWDDLT